MKRYTLLLPLMLLSLYALSQPAVQWQRALGGSNYDQVSFPESIIQTLDGGYLIVGVTTSDDGDISNLNGYSNALIIKLAASGATEWVKSYGTTTQDMAYMCRQLPDSTYVILGHGGALTEDLIGDTIVTSMPWLAKLAPQGDVIWQKYLPTGTYGHQFGFDLTSDGGFILAGYGPHECYEGIAESMQDAALTKLNAEGELEWMRCFGGSKDDFLGFVHQTADGGYIAAGTTQSSDGDLPPDAISVGGWVIRVNVNGELEWVQTYGTGHLFHVSNLNPAHDNGYLITVMNVTNTFQTSHGVYKLDELGQIEWEQTYSTSSDGGLSNIRKTTDGGYVIVGKLVSGIAGEPGGIGTPGNGWMLKIDQIGSVEWEYNIGGTWSDRFTSVVQTNDGGFAVVGELQSLAFDLPQVHGFMDIWVVKFGPLNHTLNGRIHLDLEADCLADDEEEGLAGWLVHARDASGGPANFYALTDSAGYYSVQVDSSSYVLSANASSISPYWETCLLQDTVVIVNDTHTVYMPTQILAECPYLTVDISAPFLRRCFDNTYSVHYCNYGTAQAEDAYIEMNLDPYMEFVSSTIPYSDQYDNTYLFPIGEIPVGDCGSFLVTVYLQCNETELGQTHCSSAQIYPDSLCLPPDPAWDGSSVEADVICTGDSILFTISNVGEGNMSNQLDYIIIEDQIVLMSGQFQLNSMESYFILLEANGSQATIRG
jgi:hypothetical protein